MAAESVRDRLLSLITKQHNWLIHLYVIFKRLGETFRQILQSLSSDDRLQILHIKDSETGETLLHIAATQSDTETVEMILNCVSEE